MIKKNYFMNSLLGMILFTSSLGYGMPPRGSKGINFLLKQGKVEEAVALAHRELREGDLFQRKYAQSIIDTYSLAQQSTSKGTTKSTAPVRRHDGRKPVPAPKPTPAPSRRDGDDHKPAPVPQPKKDDHKRKDKGSLEDQAREQIRRQQQENAQRLNGEIDGLVKHSETIEQALGAVKSLDQAATLQAALSSDAGRIVQINNELARELLSDQSRAQLKAKLDNVVLKNGVLQSRVEAVVKGLAPKDSVDSKKSGSTIPTQPDKKDETSSKTTVPTDKKGPASTDQAPKDDKEPGTSTDKPGTPDDDEAVVTTKHKEIDDPDKNDDQDIVKQGGPRELTKADHELLKRVKPLIPLKELEHRALVHVLPEIHDHFVRWAQVNADILARLKGHDDLIDVIKLHVWECNLLGLRMAIRDGLEAVIQVLQKPVHGLDDKQRVELLELFRQASQDLARREDNNALMVSEQQIAPYKPIVSALEKLAANKDVPEATRKTAATLVALINSQSPVNQLAAAIRGKRDQLFDAVEQASTLPGEGKRLSLALDIIPQQNRAHCFDLIVPIIADAFVRKLPIKVDQKEAVFDDIIKRVPATPAAKNIDVQAANVGMFVPGFRPQRLNPLKAGIRLASLGLPVGQFRPVLGRPSFGNPANQKKQDAEAKGFIRGLYNNASAGIQRLRNWLWS